MIPPNRMNTTSTIRARNAMVMRKDTGIFRVSLSVSLLRQVYAVQTPLPEKRELYLSNAKSNFRATETTWHIDKKTTRASFDDKTGDIAVEMR
ncbi:hypothetical protein JCM15831A_04350 [Asaia astilbis]